MTGILLAWFLLVESGGEIGDLDAAVLLSEIDFFSFGGVLAIDLGGVLVNNCLFTVWGDNFVGILLLVLLYFGGDCFEGEFENACFGGDILDCPTSSVNSVIEMLSRLEGLLVVGLLKNILGE